MLNDNVLIYRIGCFVYNSWIKEENFYETKLMEV